MSRQVCRCLACGSLALATLVVMEGVAGADLRGDFNGDGVLDAGDLYLLNDCHFPECDLDGDGVANYEDRLVWVHELKGTWIGDANFDGQFNSGDFVQVFVAGKYETGDLADWEEGDFNGDWQFHSGDMVAAFVDGGYEIGPRLLGDYNRNGLLDAGDLDLQAIEIVKQDPDLSFDLTGDGEVNFADRLMWVNDLKNTWIDDANLDCVSDSSDMVQVFAAGKYETGEPAGWAEGDLNGDTLFNSSDMVRAFAGGYEQGPKPGCRPTVPEPRGWLLLVMSTPIWLIRRQTCCPI